MLGVVVGGSNDFFNKLDSLVSFFPHWFYLFLLLFLEVNDLRVKSLKKQIIFIKIFAFIRLLWIDGAYTLAWRTVNIAMLPLLL